MKKLKKLLSITIISVLVLVNIISYAYVGYVDPDDNITILNTMENGKGTISISRNILSYKLSYQWVEIDNSIYSQIKKLKDELEIIKYFNLYEFDNTDASYNKYIAAQERYKESYGEFLTDGTEQKVNENLSLINTLLPEFTDNWTHTTNNTFSMDLANFNGTKDYVLWVQLEKADGTKVYEAEIFELTGTKQNTENGGNNQENENSGNSGNSGNSQASHNEFIDPDDNILIYKTIENGKGVISVTRDIPSYKLSYQWVEINDDLYNQIKKLKDELEIIKYFNLYEFDNTNESYDKYINAREYYKNTYGTYFTELTEQKAMENLALIDGLLSNYGNNWTLTTDNTFSMDLSTFSGTKHYILWAQVEKADGTKIHDAEIFEFTGTKQEEKPGDEDPGEEKPGDEDPGEEKPGEEKPGDEDPGEEKPGEEKPSEEKPSEEKPSEEKPSKEEPVKEKTEDKKQEPKTQNINTTTKVDTTTSTAKIPYAGTAQTTSLAGIVVFAIASIISFVKYKRIK